MLHTLDDKADRYGAVTDDAERVEVRLIRRIVAGELSEFEDIYRMYYPRLTRFLRRVTQRPELVEEVLNDTMLVVWNRAAAFNVSSRLNPAMPVPKTAEKRVYLSMGWRDQWSRICQQSNLHDEVGLLFRQQII